MSNLDPSHFQTVWDETFDGGYGALSRTWGPGVHANNGAVTLNSTADNTDSGTMVPPTGSTAGNGYGLYNFTLKMEQGDAPGPYALVWPSTDNWPGPELDLVEILQGGQAYSTVHWKGADGSNQYKSYMLDGVDVKQTHTYSLDWEAGRLTGYVDGVEKWTTTEHVPNDAAHGGENSAPGVGMQTWWSTGAQHGGGYANTMTVYDVSYAKPVDGGGNVSLPTPSTPTPTVDHTPASTSIGTGADSLVLKVAQDFYQANASVHVLVDGKDVGNFDVHALHGAGDDTVTVHGDFAVGAHKVQLTFADAYDSNADWSNFAGVIANQQDRNVYLDGASLNGKDVSGAKLAIYDAGSTNAFTVTKDAAAPSHAPVTKDVGTGADTLALHVSQDAWNGDAQYTVLVDGKQVGGTYTASALHASGQSDTLNVHADLGNGQHTVQVHFVNDAWGGTAITDRNLYVESATVNGAAVGGAQQTMLDDNGSHPVSFTVAHGETLSVTAGSAAGHLVSGFDAGDKLSLTGYGGGALLTALGHNDFMVTAADGHHELLTVPGVQTLVAGTDYVFA